MKKQRSRIGTNISTEQYKRRKALETFIVDCQKLILSENAWLSYYLPLIDALISFGGIDKWTTVRSALNDLTDEYEAKRIIKEADPGNPLYKNPQAIKDLINCLNFWLREEVISNSTTLIDVSYILSARKDENKTLLAS